MVMKELSQVFSKSNCLQGEKKIIITYSCFCLVFLLNVNVLKEFIKNKDYLFRLVRKEWLQKRIWAKKRIIFLVHGSSKNLPDRNFENIFLEKFHRDSKKILWRNCFSRLTCEICLSWIDAFMTEVSII